MFNKHVTSGTSESTALAQQLQSTYMQHHYGYVIVTNLWRDVTHVTDQRSRRLFNRTSLTVTDAENEQRVIQFRKFIATAECSDSY